MLQCCRCVSHHPFISCKILSQMTAIPNPSPGRLSVKTPPLPQVIVPGTGHNLFNVEVESEGDICESQTPVQAPSFDPHLDFEVELECILPLNLTDTNAVFNDHCCKLDCYCVIISADGNVSAWDIAFGVSGSSGIGHVNSTPSQQLMEPMVGDESNSMVERWPRSSSCVAGLSPFSEFLHTAMLNTSPSSQLMSNLSWFRLLTTLEHPGNVLIQTSFPRADWASRLHIFSSKTYVEWSHDVANKHICRPSTRCRTRSFVELVRAHIRSPDGEKWINHHAWLLSS